MTKFLSIAIVIAFAATASATEDRCTVKLADLPHASELLGFHLKMTTEQVKKRIPQVVFGSTDEFGVIKTSINPHFHPAVDKTNLEDVRTISFDFIDHQISGLWIGYESSFKWTTVEDFVKGISSALRLPDLWTIWRGRGQQLRCTDFTITVTVVAGGVSFRIVDEGAEDLLAERRRIKEELRASLESQETGIIVCDKQTKVCYSEECEPNSEISEANRVTFRTIEEAEKAGFKRAKDCP